MIVIRQFFFRITDSTAALKNWALKDLFKLNCQILSDIFNVQHAFPILSGMFASADVILQLR